MSFGALQWNLGQGTLQPLLTEMTQTYPLVLQQIFNEHYPELQAKLGADREEQLAWARSIQAPPWRHLHEPWQGYFKTLGRRPECQDLELKYAQRYYDQGLALCMPSDVRSERAVAWMFDISVQNGGVKEPVTTRIKRDFATLDSGLGGDDLEVASCASLRTGAPRQPAGAGWRMSGRASSRSRTAKERCMDAAMIWRRNTASGSRRQRRLDEGLAWAWHSRPVAPPGFDPGLPDPESVLRHDLSRVVPASNSAMRYSVCRFGVCSTRVVYVRDKHLHRNEMRSLQ